MKKESRDEKLQKILNDEELHLLMHKVVDIILSYTTQDSNDFSRPFMRFVDTSYVELTACYSEPRIGFVNSQPHELITPWGGWQCFDTDRAGKGGSINKRKHLAESRLWDTVFPVLTQRLGLQAYHSWTDGEEEYTLVYNYLTMSEVDGVSLLRYRGYHDVYHGFGNDSDLFESMWSTWRSLEARYATEHELAIYPGLEVAFTNASLHAAAHRVADIILGYATQDETVADRPLLQDTRPRLPEGTHFHTGLSLLVIDGIPSYLCTPWGVWNCFGYPDRENDRHLWDDIFPELRRRFGLYAVDSSNDGDMVEYALNEIDGDLLPKNIELDYGLKDNPYIVGKIKFAWNRLENRRDNDEK
jgi:hypothetical protein